VPQPNTLPRAPDTISIYRITRKILVSSCSVPSYAQQLIHLQYMNIEIMVFWVEASCSVIGGGAYCLHLEVRFASTYKTARCHNQEDHDLKTHSHEKPDSSLSKQGQCPTKTISLRIGSEVMKSIIFWDIMSCSPLKPYSSTLKMEATCSSETSVMFLWTSRPYISEENTLQSHYISNLIKDTH
jgi:hypothetical protein